MPARFPATSTARRQRGTTALEVAIFTIAGLVVATIATVTLLNVSFGVTGAGERTAGNSVERARSALELRPGVTAIKGNVDVDGDGSIDLGGVDRQAIVKIEFVVTAMAGSAIDLAPPYIVEDTGIDPHVYTTNASTVIRLSTGTWQVSQAAWTVSILGGGSDHMLESGERALVTLWLHPYDTENDLYKLGEGTTDPWIDSAAELLYARGRFTVQVSTRDGTGVEFERTLPIELPATVLLD